jgi:hypothetical protein
VNKVLQVNSANPQLPASKVAEAILALKPNQLLMAKILEIFPDQSAKILYDGLTITAKLDAPLSKGERYLFEVMPHSDNQTIILKKIDADPVRTAPEQVLQKLNLPVQKNEVKAVDFAIADKVPLTKENIKMIASVLKLTPSLPFKEKQQVIRQMLQLQLPASPPNVKAVISAVMQKNEQMDMKPLFDSLQAITHKSASVEKTINLMESLFGYKRNTEKINNDISNNNNNKELINKNSTQKLTGDFSETVNRVMEEPEITPVKTMKNVSLNQTQSDAPVQRTNNAAADTPGRLPASEMFLQAAEKWLKNSGLLHERNLLNNPEQVKQTETLKSQLLFLHQNGEQLELPDSVKQRIDQAINRITSQQIQNLSSNDGMQQFILQIPFHSEVHPKEITIRWEGKKAKGEKLDPEHCRMLFWLEMKHLKEVAVDVHIQNKILSVKVYSNYPSMEERSSVLLPMLKTSLNKMNYTLSSISFFEKSLQELNPAEPSSPYKGMDFRV